MNNTGYGSARSLNKTVLVVIREAAVRELVAANLGFAGCYAVQADSRSSGRQLIAQVLPDAIVVDLDSPDAAGADFAGDVRTLGRGRHIPIMMLTESPAEACGVGGTACGADDCMAKPFVPSELVSRLARLLGRPADRPWPGLLAVGPLELDPNEYTVRVHGAGGGERSLSLPAAEFKLLQHFMAEPGRVHSREQLLARVWREQSGLDPRTVDQNVKRLRSNLGAVGVGDLIETVRGVGYRLAART